MGKIEGGQSGDRQPVRDVREIIEEPDLYRLSEADRVQTAIDREVAVRQFGGDEMDGEEFKAALGAYLRVYDTLTSDQRVEVAVQVHNIADGQFSPEPAA